MAWQHPGQGPPPQYPNYPPPQPNFPGAYPQEQNYPTAVPYPPTHFEPTMYGGTSYVESEDLNRSSMGYNPFDDQIIRRGFIRKVYGILLCQLLVTMSTVAFFVFHEPTKQFARSYPWVFYLAVVLQFVILIPLVCCNFHRKAPLNYIMLSLFTACESFLMGVVASRYAPDEVLMAVGITAAVCLAITLFAFQTKYDVTGCYGFVMVSLVVLMISGFVMIFVHSKIISIVYSSIAALLFSFYLLYDTQLLLGGKHKSSVSPEDYIFAALNIYLDIIQLFLHILHIIGLARSD